MSKDAIFWYTIVVMVLFISMSATWIIFARLSMARIEKLIEEGVFQKNFQWDGIGSRIFLYAFAIVFPEKKAKRLSRLIDVDLVRGHANRADWVRGVIFLCTTYSCIILVFVGFFMDIYQ